MAKQLLERFKSVEVLVNAAGTNAPKRSLRELSLKDYHRLLDTNLNGAYYCVQAFLPGMRAQQSGTIVNIVSDAAKQASAKAGPAYVMSKFGLAGLTQSINAEEKANGIRACAIFPGDIDTPLLDLRPRPPPPECPHRNASSRRYCRVRSAGRLTFRHARLWRKFWSDPVRYLSAGGLRRSSLAESELMTANQMYQPAVSDRWMRRRASGISALRRGLAVPAGSRLAGVLKRFDRFGLF